MAEEKAKAEAPSEAKPEVGAPAVPTVDWDDSHMSTSYANVVNAASTREEVTLFFGTNQTWNPVGAQSFQVRLSDRIVLSPFAAKRLWVLLGAVLNEYEKRFGALHIDALGPDGQGKAATNPPQAPAGTRKAS
jgi:hypothetical protein